MRFIAGILVLYILIVSSSALIFYSENDILNLYKGSTSWHSTTFNTVMKDKVEDGEFESYSDVRCNLVAVDYLVNIKKKKPTVLQLTVNNCTYRGFIITKKLPKLTIVYIVGNDVLHRYVSLNKTKPVIFNKTKPVIFNKIATKSKKNLIGFNY